MTYLSVGFLLFLLLTAGGAGKKLEQTEMVASLNGRVDQLKKEKIAYAKAEGESANRRADITLDLNLDRL